MNYQSQWWRHSSSSISPQPHPAKDSTTWRKGTAFPLIWMSLLSMPKILAPCLLRPPWKTIWLSLSSSSLCLQRLLCKTDPISIVSNFSSFSLHHFFNLLGSISLITLVLSQLHPFPHSAGYLKPTLQLIYRIAQLDFLGFFFPADSTLGLTEQHSIF
jgi:hypothetical protein